MGRDTANPAGNTKGQYSFASVPRAEIPRSVFDRSSGLKTAFDAGLIIPIFTDEALPGDTMNLRMSSFCRLSTPIFPVMDNMFMDFFFFSVPLRLLWSNWEKFNGAQDDPGDSTDFTVPQTITTILEGGLADYFGLPLIAGSHQFAAFHFRAYNKIFNEWFRDENLQDSAVVDLDDGTDNGNDYVVRRRGKRHDYFTSCLPFPQKGSPVELPLGDSAPVVSAGDGVPVFVTNSTNISLSNSEASTVWDSDPGTDGALAVWGDPKLEADLSTATAATINEIRQAFQIQKLLERDARGGTRYTEILKSHFGVHSPDERLQRSEYLGGGTSRININPVASTSEATGSRDQGSLAGFGTQSTSGVGFVKSFTEHCVVLGFACVRADITYQQGINRMWSRSTRFDFYWPALSHLGEQAVLNKEIMFQDDPADLLVFGYQERFAEYRYKPSIITGKMRSTAALPLDAWHLGLDFSTLPVLNDVFIEDNPPIDRVVAVPSEPHFIGDFYFSFKHARPMPTFSVPGLIDHF